MLNGSKMDIGLEICNYLTWTLPVSHILGAEMIDRRQSLGFLPTKREGLKMQGLICTVALAAARPSHLYVPRLYCTPRKYIQVYRPGMMR